MVMNYLANRSNPARFRALTGLEVESFDELLPYFKDAHDEYFRYRQLGGGRRKGIRTPAIYSNSPLPSVAERLYFILYYLKNNPTQEAQADLYGMETPNCNRWIHTLFGILGEALSEARVTPASSDRDLAALYARMDASDLSVLLHDGTEREVPRPKDADSQRENYSGKKKRHTVKNGVISTFLGAILFVSPTVSGKTHDRSIADGHYHFPTESTVLQDTGYQGFLGDWKTLQPIKRTRGGTLNEHQMRFNREISSKRVKVEHHIGSAKILRIVKDECRLRKNRFTDTVFHVACAIHNLRRGVKLPLKNQTYLA